MCMCCEKDMGLVEATYLDGYGNEYFAHVDIKNGKLRVRLVKATMDDYEELAFDEAEIALCPVCGKKL